MNRELILDSRSINEFLTMASNEKLLVEDINKTDAFLHRFSGKEVPEARKTAILEQMILSDRLVTTLRFPTHGISGQLVDDGLLNTIDDPKLDDIHIRKVPIEIICSMVNYIGPPFSLNEISVIVDRFS